MKQEDIVKVLETLGSINVAGDLVLEKHVEHEVNNVEAGGIGIQIVNGKVEEAAQHERQEDTLAVPEVLAKSELWQRVKEAGFVDECGQPTVSRPEAALLAYKLAERLGISNKWKLFEQLWQRNNMRNDYNQALEQKKSLVFQDKLKNVIDR